MPSSAASSPRVIAGDCGNRLEFRRQPRFACPRRYGRDAGGQVGARLDLGRPAIVGKGTIEVLPLLENGTCFHQRRHVGPIQLDGLPQVLQRAIAIALPMLDGPELAIQERTVGRGRDRPLIRDSRLVQPAASGGVASPLDHVLHVAELQHLDAPAHIRQRAVERERLFECGQRIRITLQAEQRLAATDECRHVGAIGRERSIERTQRLVVLAACQRHESFPSTCRIEGPAVLQGALEFPLRVPEVVILKKTPAALDCGCCGRRLQRLRHRRVDELRILQR